MLGVRGLAELHSDLNVGASIDYRFTPCPYCDGISADPTLPLKRARVCSPPQPD
ncbi:hypothetical protein ACIA74_41520 [Streptomyces sp. NPDC051658]|uniref:hypothetical protein n=1 Tax=Streptomyces sp. NPDC051658 TaxID=3365667 RepID=UPI00379D3B27